MLWQLASVFGLLSLLSFGGGNALIPQIYADTVGRHWITATQFARYFALARLAPGPTMNISTLVGYSTAGVLGAIVATAALFVPAAIIVFVMGRVWRRLHGNIWRNRVAAGFAPVVAGLLWASVPTIARGAVDGAATAVIALAATAVLLRTRLNQALIIFAAGVVGFALFR